MRSLKTYILCSFTFALTVFAQSDRGTITGTVTDQAGAAVPSLEIVLRNVATDAVFKSVTTSVGDYTATSLPAGLYQLTVAAPGFKTFHQDGITAQVAQTVRVDVVLQI